MSNLQTTSETKVSPQAPSQPALHVVLGAGQVGSRLATLLQRRGHLVRLVRRGSAGPAQPGLSWASGDMTDQAFAAAATAGAAVVYDCMNPPYHRWQEQLMALGGGALLGATRAGAKLV